jgi:NAD(P)H-nitrite reductase large subunit
MSTNDPEKENPLVCFCFRIREQEVLSVIRECPVETVMDITAHCKAGNGCTSCWPLLEELLRHKTP